MVGGDASSGGRAARSLVRLACRFVFVLFALAPFPGGDMPALRCPPRCSKTPSLGRPRLSSLRRRPRLQHLQCE
eukprot:715314-Pyramimonas_sp.AAC.1